ncbi:MAG: class I SAM-dependent methyltransferase [Negativicutes bacterium]|nr:class I SAM-dependent methyltransferase [Negativicutes bacterium]
MKDNKTSQPAHEYDGNVTKTMPYYEVFHKQSLELIEVLIPQPAAWLDTGCGTGTLVQQAARRFPATRFFLADPSAPMLDIAKGKLAGAGACEFVLGGTEELEFAAGSFDIITAILAHHYLDAATRRAVTAKCWRMLNPGGVYITFETIRPRSELGLKTGLEIWRRAQIRGGKSDDAAHKHIKRYGVEYFPITLAEHIGVLEEAGFAAVEVLWLSGMQAGLYAVK